MCTRNTMQETANAKEKVIIIGSGPAGLTAAIYTSRALLKPLMFEGYQAGGQLMTTTDVENFPGFPEGVMGPEMMQMFRKQAERFGTRLETKDVTKVDLSSKPYKIWVGQNEYETDSVIIATGATAKLLGLEAEKTMMGRGVSTCATCDGAFYKDKEVAVVGGGDSALEEAMFLTRFANKVTVIHRREELRASQIMQERAKANKKIEWLWNTVVDDIVGDNSGVTGLKLSNINNADEKTELNVQGVFIAIGHKPMTKLFEGQLELSKNGYILTQEGSKTSKEGVFACGDVQDEVYRQAITAAASGCMAAIDCERYLETLEE
ncbi:MAG TPA: thioredoxin-disulfide reductase [Oligoflexia bacterium]|nr:thioredoxin-disulfide reductase [Oligoflexia bacterium]HMR24840.1 thioredoxin-disulfide reductase [Oligoflexia bacterium]